MILLWFIMPKTRKSVGRPPRASTTVSGANRGRPSTRGGRGATLVVPSTIMSTLPHPVTSTSTSSVVSTATTDASFTSSSAMAGFLAAIREEVRQEIARQTAGSLQTGAVSTTTGPSVVTDTSPVFTASSPAVAGPSLSGMCLRFKFVCV